MTSEVDEQLERLMSPRVLRLLIELEERGGVGAAARAVKMTQPSASRSLAALEKQLGFTLVRRTRLGSTLTSEGAAIVGQAREVLAEYRQLDALARSLGGSVNSGIRIATSRTVGEHLVPRWIPQLSGALPGLSVSFHVDNSRAVIDEVLRGEAPLGFIETPQRPAGVASRVIGSDRLVIIAPPESELPRNLGWRPLRRLHLVEREPGSGTRATLDEHAKHRAAPAAQFDSNTAIVQAVAAGVGPAVLSELAVQDAIREGKVRKIDWEEDAPTRSLRAIWSTELGLSEAAARVLDAVRN